MATKINDKQVKALLRKGEPGRFAAGGGLYFRVSQEGTGFWVVRYTIHGKRREHSLGRYCANPGELPLVEATAKAAQIKADIKSVSIQSPRKSARPVLIT